jgi:hypothetical protein
MLIDAKYNILNFSIKNCPIAQAFLKTDQKGAIFEKEIKTKLTKKNYDFKIRRLISIQFKIYNFNYFFTI